jgi:ATP-dependent Clp protease protease subunit
MIKKPTINEMFEKLFNGEEVFKSFDAIMEAAQAFNRQVYIGEITEETGDAIDSAIRFWNWVDEESNTPIEERKPIKIYINSPGGSLTGTFTIINAIEMSKTPVYTINTGTAYSGGFFIFIAGHKRFAYPLSSFLFHEGSVGNGGTASQFANFAAFYKTQLKQLKQVVLKYTKIDEEKYKEIQKDDFWLTADEALELGICDEIIKEFI